MTDRGDSAKAVQADLRLKLLASADRIKRIAAKQIPPYLKATLSPDDVFQEVCLAAFRSIDEFVWESSHSFERWIMTLAENELIDALRAAQRFKHGRLRRGPRDAAPAHLMGRKCVDLSNELLASPGRSPSRVVAGREAAGVVREALQSLPPDQARVLSLFHLEGCAPGPIADALGMTINRVRYLLYTGRQSLRRQLGHAGKFFTDAVTAELPPALRTDP